MRIVGAENLSLEQIEQDVREGGRFVIFYYAVSAFVITFKFPTDIYYLRPGQSATSKSLSYTLITLVAGWWGFPFGPIYSIMALVNNLSGGKNVTAEVLRTLRPPLKVPPVAGRPGGMAELAAITRTMPPQ